MLRAHTLHDTVAMSVDQRYLVGRTIAHHERGLVREAIHSHTGRRVALKLLVPELRDDSRARQRMLREAAFLGSIRHPNVVAIADAGLCGEWGAYIAMENLVGRPLDGWLTSRTRVTLDEARPILDGLLDALSAIHARRIVHRDLKPGNVVLVGGSTLTPVVVDFGSAVEVELADGSRRAFEEPDPSTRLEYVAPEILAGRAADPRSDLFSFGVIAFEILTGTLPYAPGEVLVADASLADRVRNGLLDAGLPYAIADVVRTCLAIEPDARFRDAPQTQAAFAAAYAQAPAAAPSLQAGASRRTHVRMPYVTPMRATVLGGTDVDGRTEDIALGGILFVSHAPMQVGDVVMLRLPLPMSGRLETVPSTVRWVRPGRLRNAIGLAFDGLSTRAQEEIERYVAIGNGSRDSEAAR